MAILTRAPPPHALAERFADPAPRQRRDRRRHREPARGPAGGTRPQCLGDGFARGHRAPRRQLAVAAQSERRRDHREPGGEIGRQLDVAATAAGDRIEPDVGRMEPRLEIIDLVLEPQPGSAMR